MIQEIWKDIPGFEGYYQCSSFGKVRSLDRIIKGKRIKGKTLKPMVTEKGYEKVELRKDNKRSHGKVHRLVALTFISNPFNFKEVNHIDCDKRNNCCFNLEWTTRINNMRHAEENARMIHPKGENHHRTTLTNLQVLEIRSLCESKKMTKRAISKIYNVSESTIGDIYKRKVWKHI